MLTTIITNPDEELKWFGVKELGEETLAERWSRVKEDFWGDIKRETQIALKKILETGMEVEIQDLVGSDYWKHNPGRKNYRNGYYTRSLLSSFGCLEIDIPRVRFGGIEFKCIEKYQRRTKDVDDLILEMFLNGVSTRKVEEVLRPLFGPKSVSAGLVSKITKVLNKQVKRFHERKLTDRYEYLIFDAIFLNTKSPVYKKPRCVLVAYGMWKVGDKVRCELIDFRIASHGESESAWNGFLYNLYYRGLEGKNLKLVTTDGNKGLCNTIETIYPNAKRQRCWVHKLRNVAKKVPRKFQDLIITEAAEIYNASSYSEAVKAYREWYKRWQGVAPEAVRCLDEDIEELLNFYSCPEELWKKLRTTNAIERAFREIRRRTRPMSCFQNRESLERIIYALFYRMNKKWGNDDISVLENSLFNEITQNY